MCPCLTCRVSWRKGGSRVRPAMITSSVTWVLPTLMAAAAPSITALNIATPRDWQSSHFLCLWLPPHQQTPLRIPCPERTLSCAQSYVTGKGVKQDCLRPVLGRRHQRDLGICLKCRFQGLTRIRYSSHVRTPGLDWARVTSRAGGSSGLLRGCDYCLVEQTPCSVSEGEREMGLWRDNLCRRDSLFWCWKWAETSRNRAAALPLLSTRASNTFSRFGNIFQSEKNVF